MRQQQTDSGPLGRVLAKIDDINRGDPTRERIENFEYPRELVYSNRLSAWVMRLSPSASDELRIAARGQHVARWTIPRDRYPMDRAGYLRWREDLKKMHADTVAGVMREVGYPENIVERVRSIILKKNVKADPDTQTIEDALCLVFLETQFADLRQKTPEDKMIVILKKTWAKMSPLGRSMAKNLLLPEKESALLAQAIGGL